MLTCSSFGLRQKFVGERRNVSSLLSVRKHRLTSASRGEEFRILNFSMFSGYLHSLYLDWKQSLTHIHQACKQHSLLMSSIHCSKLVSSIHSTRLVSNIHSSRLVSNIHCSKLVSSIHSSRLVSNIQCSKLVSNIHCSRLVSNIHCSRTHSVSGPVVQWITRLALMWRTQIQYSSFVIYTQLTTFFRSFIKIF